MQYGALRRKIGGTYKDFFKSYIEGMNLKTLQFIWKPSKFRSIIFNNASNSLYLILVDGQYVEEGWVDKTCKVCKKDTKGEPRQVDKLGRYVHVECLEKSKSGNFFTRLFSG